MNVNPSPLKNNRHIEDGRRISPGRLLAGCLLAAIAIAPGCLLADAEVGLPSAPKAEFNEMVATSGPSPLETSARVQQRSPQGDRPVEKVPPVGPTTPGAVEPPVGSEGEFDPAGAGFAVQVGEDVIPYELMAISVMPGEAVRIDPVLGNRRGAFDVEADEGAVKKGPAGGWVWTAPERPDLYRVRITETTTGDRIQLQAFVLTPYDGQDVLEGYRVGAYERIPLRQNPAYEMPRGFIRLTRDMVDVPVSPHFRLGQFVGKQASDYPKFLLVRTRLLLKLEMLLSEVNRAGIEAESFHVMSAFRTPFYNRSIGNKTRYSRHCYGDAADVFVDEDGDGRSDDLNGDGKVDRGDVEKMAKVIEDLTSRPWYQPFVGGLGIYGPAPHRGPFIHVDTRGFRARW